MKIVHAADIHLGRRRLDGRLPDVDFARAFEFIARQAVAAQADVCLIAGDMFDRSQVEPPHLQQAVGVLRLLKEARIPVIAIEGNHDRAFVHGEAPSWVSYLAEDDLLVLLRPRFDANGAVLEPWNPHTKTGAWIDIGGVRFTGAGYLGAATPHKLKQVIAALKHGATHVLLLHAGQDYFVGEGGGFGKEDLANAKTKVRYLALGHIHKPHIIDGWACNPGSPENGDLQEATYGHLTCDGKRARGYAVVTIDPTQPGMAPQIEICDTQRRPCVRIDLECTGIKSEEQLSTLALAAIRARRATPEAWIDLRLRGSLNLDRVALARDEFCEQLRKEANIAAVSLDAFTLNLASAAAASGSAPAISAAISREELEKNAIRQLVEKEGLFGLADCRDEFAALFHALKQQAIQRCATEEFAERIATHSLVDRVRTALPMEAAT